MAQDPAQAGQEDKLTAEYNAAMNAFQTGSYADAAAKLESVISQAGQGAKLESVYYTLGAAYFNAGDYSKAAEVLRKYQAQYPQGGRINEVTLSIAQACMMSKDYPGAAEQYAKLAGVPQLREQALLYGGIALKEAGRQDDALKTLEALVAPGIKSATAVKGAMVLAGLYGGKKQGEKAAALISEVIKHSDLVENLARLNAMAVELGDSQVEAGRPEDALVVYHAVRTKPEVIAFQEQRVVKLQKKLDETLAAMRANPKDAAQYFDAINAARSDLVEAKQVSEEAKKMQDFMPAVCLRMGRAYYDMGLHWESLVAYGEVLSSYPDAKEGETAMFGAVVDYAEANRPQQARELGEKYLKKFPAGKNAETVGYLMGASALQDNDPQTAERYFGRMLNEQPNSTFKEQMRYLLANAKFAQANWDGATADYAKYKSDFPKGAYVEDVDYRMAVGLVFAGKYEKAIPEVEKFIAEYPKSNFVPDARYRLALCYYAASQYDDVIQRCEDWEKEFPNDQQLGETLALKGDALMAKGSTAEAVEAYIRSFKAATTDEVLNYSINEAQKGMAKQGDWERMGAVYQEFVNANPEHPLVPMTLFWIGKAMARQGKADEAKQFFATTIRKYIDDPRRDAVEQMISQLAQMCAKKRRPAPVAEATPAVASGTGAAATPAPTPTPTPEPQIDPAVELDILLGGAGDQSQTAKARIVYAKSELALYRRKPDEQKALLLQIAKDFKPEDLSSLLLAQVGDRLLAAGDREKAEAFFQKLMDDYPKSPFVDFAYNGLGQIAFDKQEYEKALGLYSDVVDRGEANMKLKELTLGRAQVLLALGKLDEAQPVFEQVASVREWRGEATAQAVFALGEIEFKRGKWAEANAYYQRVYVAYQKFLPVVAKAYLQSGECFQKLGRNPEAVKTYQEMLRNEKLAKFTETAEARKRVGQLGGGS